MHFLQGIIPRNPSKCCLWISLIIQKCCLTKIQVNCFTFILDGWYSRIENNAWRPVSDGIWDSKQDYNPLLPSTKSVLFHHSNLVRRQELEKKKRDKRIKWMKKMYIFCNNFRYTQGKAMSENLSPIEEIDEGMKNEIETDGLIKWTEALDFEKYFDNWTQLATSGSNDHSSVKNTSYYGFEPQLEKDTERSCTPQTQISLSELMIK